MNSINIVNMVDIINSTISSIRDLSLEGVEEEESHYEEKRYPTTTSRPVEDRSIDQQRETDYVTNEAIEKQIEPNDTEKDDQVEASERQNGR